MISNSNVGCAGHSLYNSDFGSGKWISYVVVIPAKSANNSPYGQAVSTKHEVGGNWADHGDETDDWGVITLDRSFSIGYMGLMAPGNNIVGWQVRAQGYPDDATQMYLISDNVLTATDRYLTFKQKVRPGMSGGPCIEGRNYIIGIIHAHTSSGTSYIVKFDDWLFNKMSSYR